MRVWQYAVATTLLFYIPLRVFTDDPYWKVLLASAGLSLGLFILIDWLRATTEPPDPRQRWRR
jgi:hypothetical protein